MNKQPIFKIEKDHAKWWQKHNKKFGLYLLQKDKEEKKKREEEETLFFQKLEKKRTFEEDITHQVIMQVVKETREPEIDDSNGEEREGSDIEQAANDQAH